MHVEPTNERECPAEVSQYGLIVLHCGLVIVAKVYLGGKDAVYTRKGNSHQLDKPLSDHRLLADKLNFPHHPTTTMSHDKTTTCAHSIYHKRRNCRGDYFRGQATPTKFVHALALRQWHSESIQSVFSYSTSRAI